METFLFIKTYVRAKEMAWWAKGWLHKYEDPSSESNTPGDRAGRSLGVALQPVWSKGFSEKPHLNK